MTGASPVRWIWAAGITAVAILATLGEGGATPNATLGTHALLAILIVAALLVRRAEGSSGAARGPVLAFAACALWVGLGAVQAPYTFGAWLVVLEVASFAGAFWLALRAGNDLDRFLPPALAMAGALHGTAAAAARLAGVARPATTFLNPNHLGAWLVAPALVATAWALAGTGHRRIVGALAAALAVAGVAATGSRGALLALVAGLSTIVMLRWRRERARVRILLVAGGGAAIVLAGALVLSRLADADPYHWERVRIWKASLGAVVEDPWFGSGPGQFRAAAANLNFAQEEATLRFGRTFRSPHSDLLRPFVEFGWPAGLAALAAGMLALREAVSRRRAGSDSALFVGSLSALTALGAQAVFDDLTARPALVVLAAVLAGGVLARPRLSVESIPLSLRATAAAGLFVLFAAGEVAPWIAWREANALPRGRLDPAQRGRLQVALDRNPLHPDSWRRLAEHEAGDGSDWDASGYARAREAAEEAVRLQPADAAYRRAAAWVEGMACRTLFHDRATRDRAAERYREAADVARHDATIPLDEAQFLLGTGDPEGARRAAERALRIEPRAATPRVVLAEALLESSASDASVVASRLLEEAESLDATGTPPSSAYDLRLRFVDRTRVAALRRRVSELAR